MEIPQKPLSSARVPCLFVVCLETRCALPSSLLAFVHRRRQEDISCSHRVDLRPTVLGRRLAMDAPNPNGGLAPLSMETPERFKKN